MIDDLFGTVTSCVNGYYHVDCDTTHKHLRRVLMPPSWMNGAVIGDTVRLSYLTTHSTGQWYVTRVLNEREILQRQIDALTDQRDALTDQIYELCKLLPGDDDEEEI